MIPYIDIVRVVRYIRYMNDQRIPEWTLGDRLVKARQMAGIEQSDMASQLGVSRQSVYAYERNRVRPKLMVLRLWAQLCDVPLEWLVEPEAGVRSWCFSPRTGLYERRAVVERRRVGEVWSPLRPYPNFDIAA